MWLRLDLDDYSYPPLAPDVVWLTLDIDLHAPSHSYPEGRFVEIEDVSIVVCKGQVIGETTDRPATPAELSAIQDHLRERYNEGGDKFEEMYYGWRSFQDWIDEACMEKAS